MTIDATGRRILVVEDEYFIAEDLTQTFESVGAIVVGPVPIMAEALDILDGAEQIDGAVLDINLRGELAWPIADKLIASKIPFVFATGYDSADIPSDYASIKRCSKPARAAEVMQALFS